MKIYFSHGKESGPWGSKIKALAEIAKTKGFDVESIDYQHTLDPDLRVKILLEELKKKDDEIILVGSSMGAYVSLVASDHIKVEGVFLLAPALNLAEYNIQSYTQNQKNLAIIHGWSDELIPYQNAINYAKTVKCDLHLIEGNHRLKSSLDTICDLFELYLSRFNS